MTTQTLRRWGAVLLTGGLLLAVDYLIYPSSADSPLIRPAAALGLVGIVLVITGLVAYQRGQAGRAPVNGWTGTTILCAGLGMLEIPHLVLGAFSPGRLLDLDAYHAGVWGQLQFLGIIGITVGMIVLAVATGRSGTYPRWAVWTLVANIALSALDTLVAPLSDALHAPAPNYLLTALSGLAMIRVAQARVKARPDPATRSARPDSATSAAL